MSDPVPNNPALAWVVPVIAGAILIGFAVLCGVMLYSGLNLGKDDQFRWDRALFVFNAVQAIATAAAGALLGTVVQQGRVATAEGRAANAEADAKLNADEARKAKAARKLLSDLQPPGGDRPPANIEALVAVLR